MSTNADSSIFGKIREEQYETVQNDNEHPFWVPQYGKTYADPQYHQIRPRSDVGCVEYIISGTGVINVANKTYIVRAGDTYLLPQWLDMNYYSDYANPMEKIWFNFKGPLAESIIKLYSLQNTYIFKGVDTRNLILKMHKAANSSGVPKKVQNITSSVFLEIIQFLSEQNVPADSENISLAERVRIYIDQHLTENITVADLAEVFDRSRVYISNAFKKAHNIPPHQYIIQSKIKMAASILAAARKPTRVVAEMVGFADEKDFVRHFKNEYGTTPAKYREQRIQAAAEVQKRLQEELMKRQLEEFEEQ